MELQYTFIHLDNRQHSFYLRQELNDFNEPISMIKDNKSFIQLQFRLNDIENFKELRKPGNLNFLKILLKLNF